MTRAAHFERFLPIVRHAAMQASACFPDIPFDELAAWAWLGVLEAFQRRRGDLTHREIEAYAMYRIHGAMLDAADRRQAGALVALSARLTTAIELLSERLCRAPDEDEIADELGIRADDYRDALLAMSARGMTRLEVVGVDVHVAEDARADLETSLAIALTVLPTGHRDLFELHYGACLPLRDAGERLGIGESRAIQLHVEGIHRLRAAIG